MREKETEAGLRVIKVLRGEGGHYIGREEVKDDTAWWRKLRENLKPLQRDSTVYNSLA
jgi:hypothetical protein